MQTPLAKLKQLAPMLAQETEETWRARLVATNVARFYDRATLRDVAAYARAQAECQQLGAYLVIEAPALATPLDESTQTGVPRATARVAQHYAVAKALAAKDGREAAIVDE